MREIGGYLEWEHSTGKEYYADGVALNLARNALEYVLRAQHIHTLLTPDFLCDSVRCACERAGVAVELYPVTAALKPALPEQISAESWVYLVDYYGTLSDAEVQAAARQCGGRVILDRVQAFFAPPCPGIDTLYSCRKYFGVPDGAYLFPTQPLGEALEPDASAQRVSHLLGRYEQSAALYYEAYRDNEALLDALPLRAMSPLTHNLLRSIDYDAVRSARNRNAAVVQASLKEYNKLDYSLPEGPYAYPLWVQNGRELRRRLQAQKIYVPTLWPDVLERCEPACVSWQLAADLLPLPVDQRYTAQDMEAMCGLVRREIERLS